MKGPFMWIILGVLIALVICFLITSAVLDKKKRKRQTIQEQKMKKIQKIALGKIVIKINLIILKNKEMLDNFVPSIGKFKMSEINKLAKNELSQIKRLSSFKNFKKDNVIINNYDALCKVKSNNWNKQCIKELKFFKAIEKRFLLSEDKEEYKNFKIKENNRLIGVYK